MAEPLETPDRAVGRAVQRLRTQAGLSQAEMAERMRERGWKWLQPTSWSVEQGKRPLRFAEAVDLAPLLGARLEDLLSDPLEGTLREARALASDADTERSRAQVRAAELTAQADALADVQRASRGEQVTFGPHPASRARSALADLPDDRLTAILGHLGADDQTIQEVLEIRAADQRGETMGDVFGAVLWGTLHDLVPTLRAAP